MFGGQLGIRNVSTTASDMIRVTRPRRHDSPPAPRLSRAHQNRRLPGAAGPMDSEEPLHTQKSHFNSSTQNR
jgi:hypothetical protein